MVVPDLLIEQFDGRVYFVRDHILHAGVKIGISSLRFAPQGVKRDKANLLRNTEAGPEKARVDPTVEAYHHIRPITDCPGGDHCFNGAILLPNQGGNPKTRRSPTVADRDGAPPNIIIQERRIMFPKNKANPPIASL